VLSRASNRGPLSPPNAAGTAKPGGDIYGDLRAASVRQECEDSLRRLKVERIISIRSTGPIRTRKSKKAGARSPNWFKEGQDSLCGRIQLQRAQIGTGQQDSPYRLGTTAVQPVAARRGGGRLPFCKAQRIGVVAYGPMQEGLLSGRVHQGAHSRFARG